MLFWKRKKKDGDEAIDAIAEGLDNAENAFSAEAEDAVSDAAEKVSSVAEEAAGAVSEAVCEAAETVNDAAEEAAETVNTAAENTAEAVSAAAEDAAEASEEPAPKKKGFFRRLVEGMSKTRNNLADGLRGIFGGNKIDEDFYEELEEILIMADIGVNTTGDILERLRERVKEERVREPAECRRLLMDAIKEQMAVPADAYAFEEKPSVVLMVGVNGVGKTTTAGKIAGALKDNGKKVLLAAADTFRAAATEQLIEWSHRAGCEIIAAKEGADPAAVVFDAVTAAKARKVDVLICDTAGRLHNKKNLMDELGKINRVIDREYPQAHRETFVVLDATTGQNALVQAKEFNEIADVTGIVITKMDGTAKGGIVIAIQKELGIPVKYIGVGEKIDDMQRFDPDAFVEALFATGDEAE